MVYKLDSEKWHNELRDKSSIVLYKTFKLAIKEEKVYTNDFESVILFKIRSNTLKLNWRKRFEDGNTLCPLCLSQEETLLHFLVECHVLDPVRRELGIENLSLEELLLFKESRNPVDIKTALKQLYNHRALLI